MYKIMFIAQGTNALQAVERLQTVGLCPERLGDVVSVIARKVDPVRSLLDGIEIVEWSAEDLTT